MLRPILVPSGKYTIICISNAAIPYFDKGYYLTDSKTVVFAGQATLLQGGIDHPGLEVTLIPKILGDLSQDGVLDLTDVIKGLPVITNLQRSFVGTGNDVNSDGRIGLEDIIYTLEELSK